MKQWLKLSSLIGAFLSVIFVLSGCSELKFQKNETKDIENNEEEKLLERYEEIFKLSDDKAGNEQFYDLYLSPESKQRIAKAQYLENQEKGRQSLNKEVMDKLREVHKVVVKGDTGYIERTLTVCFNQECSDKIESKGYKKYVKINNEWFAVHDDKPIYCIRDEAYDMPEEFKRALSLITQRYEDRGNTAEANNLENIKNCLRIEYSETSKEINGAEGVFVFSPSHSLDEYLIKVSPKYSIKDDLLTAVLLRHELTHVFQYANNKDINSSEGCYKSEVEAFTTEGQFIYQVLNSEERKSLESRIANSSDVAGLFGTFLTIAKNQGDLVEEKTMNYLMANPYYQKQCGQYPTDDQN